MSERHWDDFYSERPVVPWHEPLPSTLDLVVRYSTPNDSVIDVGGGASLLPLHLLGRGYSDITVVDFSEVALARSRAHLPEPGRRVHWIHHDITTFEPHRQWSVWHDRAVFHFLTDPDDRASYVSVAERAVRPGGTVVVSTFGPDGPEQCAMLPVCRYNADSLAAEFGPSFAFVDGGPITPPSKEGDQRPYVAVVLTRR